MTNINDWKEGVSMMLMELLSLTDGKHSQRCEEIASTIEGQIERVIDLAPDDEDIH